MAFNISNKIQKIISFDAKAETIKIIEDNKKYLSELLKNQLEVGEDGFGKDVKVNGNSFYQPFTIENKRHPSVRGLGRVTEWITNYMTGEFYKGIHPLTDGSALTFKSSVPYFDAIISQSGGAIMKLNDYHLKKFKEEKLIPELKKRMKKQ